MKLGLFAFFASILLINVFGQPNTPKNVWNFQTVTWNSRGAKWDVVAYLMRAGFEILAIQEAGARPTTGVSSPALPNPPRLIINTIRERLSNGNVAEYSQEFLVTDEFALTEEIWQIGGANYFLYSYDRTACDDGSGVARSTSQQNIAIVSRYRAQNIFIVPPEVLRDHIPRRQERVFINRPGIGIHIENSVFFNLHPEPCRDQNEARTLVETIERHMSAHYMDLTWMVMADFNRIPSSLNNLISTNGAKTINPIVRAPNVPTHQANAILDYSIVGGPVRFFTELTQIPVGLVQNLPPGGHRSDHNPVCFN